MKGRYAPFIPAPVGGSGVGARDQKPAVRACKLIEFFGATRQKSGI